LAVLDAFREVGCLGKKKEYWLDYATHAFVRYAKLGGPTRKEYEEKLRCAAIKEFSMLPPEKAALKIERAIKDREGCMLDIDAVNAVLKTLKKQGKREIIGAICAVYFENPIGKPRKGAITSRARRYAIECPADERTVYKWLKSARRLFAIYRGLDMDSEDEEW
jgi:hypothetical protein